MNRFRLEDGILIPDENGDYMFVSEHKEIITTIKAQVDALDAYVDALQDYLNTLI